MKKAILFLSLITSIFYYSQSFSTLDKILEKLEAKEKTLRDASHYDMKDKKFIIIEDFNDHSERHILQFNADNSILLTEVIDDKSTGKTSSNIFTGDYIRKKNAVSIRADQLEGKKIPIPVTYNLYIMNANNIWYLKDINTNKRWIENNVLIKKQK